MENEEIQNIHNSVSVHMNNKAKPKLICTEHVSDGSTDSMVGNSRKKLNFMKRKINSSNVTEPQVNRHKTIGRNKMCLNK